MQGHTQHTGHALSSSKGFVYVAPVPLLFPSPWTTVDVDVAPVFDYAITVLFTVPTVTLLVPSNAYATATFRFSSEVLITSSSAIAEGPRDALSQLKS